MSTKLVKPLLLNCMLRRRGERMDNKPIKGAANRIAKNKKISRAEVHFCDHGTVKVCEIELVIYENLLLIQRSSDQYDKAVREALMPFKSR
jgi:hypothetical protein